MRTIGRVFVTAQDIAADAQTALARAAENSGLEGVWVHGPPSGHGDSYATTLAAAIASSTTDLRVGVVLRLTAPEDVLRLAEDVAVLDHCSSGRAEICLDGRWAGDLTGDAELTWSGDAVRLMTNLRTCAVGERRLAVTPGPLQPAIPAVARGPAVPIAGMGTVTGIGAVTGMDDVPGPSDRVVLHVDAERALALVDAAASPDSLGPAIALLRDRIDHCGAQDIIFEVPTGPGGDAGAGTGTDTAADAVTTLASVVAPILRANEDEVADLVLDTGKFRAALARR